MTHPDLATIAAQFQIPGTFLSATPFGTGHINDTHCVVLQQSTTSTRFILQRINRHVFSDPAALMQNIVFVTGHIARKTANLPDRDRRTLTLIPARDGRPFHIDASGDFWRAFHFIEDSHTLETVESPQQAFQAAAAFGRFQSLLADLPASQLHDTIPGFHDTPGRFQALHAAIAADTAHCAAEAAPEIAFALAHEHIANLLLAAQLPLRVTHNDTKLNNVLLDDQTGEALCVIDLDTVMPGLAPFDFGDMVRTATSPTPEDDPHAERVTMQFPMFEALLRGFLSTAGEFLTPSEKQQLVNAGIIIALEQGVRFLTDFLAGDAYYKVSHPLHNLHRCRTQFRLVESIRQQEDAMLRLLHLLL